MDLGGSSSTESSQQLNHGSTSDMEENSTTLLNLPPICLDYVLKHLDLTDLTNAANSHSVLTASAIRVFDLYVKHKPIVLCHSRHKVELFRNRYHKELKPIIQFVSDESLFPSILNFFGPKMESLGILNEDRFILDKVIEKCSPNLTKLHVLVDQNDFRLNNRFPKLHELVFIITRLSCLEIHNYLDEELDFDETFLDHFPNLTQLAFTTSERICKHNHNEYKFVDFFPEFSPFYSSFNRWETPIAPLLRSISKFVNANNHINSLRLHAYSDDMRVLRENIDWLGLEMTDFHLLSEDLPDDLHDAFDYEPFFKRFS